VSRSFRSDFSRLTPQRVAKIAHKLNNRPRKCLGYRTPAEILGPALRRQIEFTTSERNERDTDECRLL
jgi:hypothetical protein